MEFLFTMVVPLTISGVALYGVGRRVDVYSALIHGAEEGLETLLRIVPALVGLLTAVSMLRASGALDLAARLLARHNVGSLPVCGSGGQLQGMVTDRDIVLRCVAAEEDPRSVPVRSIMSRRPAVVTPEDDVRQAARLMSSQQVRRLPVVDKGRVVGVVSLGDLAKCGRYEMEISRALTDISENIRQP